MKLLLQKKWALKNEKKSQLPNAWRVFLSEIIILCEEETTRGKQKRYI